MFFHSLVEYFLLEKLATSEEFQRNLNIKIPILGKFVVSKMFSLKNFVKKCNKTPQNYRINQKFLLAYMVLTASSVQLVGMFKKSLQKEWQLFSKYLSYKWGHSPRRVLSSRCYPQILHKVIKTSSKSIAKIFLYNQHTYSTHLLLVLVY